MHNAVVKNICHTCPFRSGGDCTDEHKLCNCDFVVLKKPGHHCHLFITEAGCFVFYYCSTATVLVIHLSPCSVTVVKYIITKLHQPSGNKPVAGIIPARVVNP